MLIKNGYIFISTIDNEEKAKEIAKKVVEEKLAGCVSIIPGVNSTYYWQGKLETSSEFILIFKTTRKKIKDLREYIKKIHTYEVPELATIKVNFNKSYKNWLINYVNKD